ncbi:5-methyltetrahydrofolate--homocysteine methyltransferase [uncultured Paraglaciecola sp.]|uniref:5-methyltetrahydrofolate--homocysteine methyltransferase n=1 Tax=uncultured Paraglaciecola sp. TaxID=1765024 RepID=UPI002598C4A0|nr:5-methyltetrahydrofolate--homocysteine methyltransferase [uncultured Paraglaciecola sp.]
MSKLPKLNILAMAIASLMLYGCGDATTNIIEKESIVEEEDEHDHDEDDDEYTIESMGRLAVLSAESNEATIFDLDDNELLDTFTLIHDTNTLTASADYRFAVVTSRSNDYVGFIDGGMWREDHVEHLHDYEQTPAMSDFELEGSRPTHVIKYDGQTAVFFDGDAETSLAASVQVVSDTDISSNTTEVATLEYAVNMHGVAEPNSDHLLSTIRRDDAETTSATTILPDQVSVYHLHDGEYEQEQVLEVTCPDLHGAAQNEEYTIFGCSDGVLVAYQESDEEYHAEKIPNIDALNDVRIGSIYSHEENDSFIGVASAYGVEGVILVNITPESGMEVLEWQPETDAAPISYGFAYEGEHFLILDELGFLNVLSGHDHDGEIEWELETSINISDEDLSNTPEGMSFSFATAQNGHYVYVSDPIAQHILQIDLESMTITDDIEVDFSPASLTWLGIAEEEHDHD